MNLNGVMLGSEDPKKLSDFYTQVLGKPIWDDGGNWKGWKLGKGEMAIGPHSDVKGKNQSPGRIMVTFTCDDVKVEFERIKKLGAEVVAEPYQPDQAQGMWLSTFADPDGNYFQISTPWAEASTDQK